jgi:hypothetical protein
MGIVARLGYLNIALQVYWESIFGRCNMSNTNMPRDEKPKLDRSGVPRIITVLASTLIFSVILFGISARLNWWQAWVYLFINIAIILVNGFLFIKNNPETINERGRMGKDVKGWDKVIGLYIPCCWLAR